MAWFWKKPKPKARKFKAANHDRLTWSWVTAPTTADYDIKSGLTALRARSREAYQNNEFVKQFVRLTQSNVIGHRGIVLQSRVRLAKGEPDYKAAAAIEAAHAEWAKRGNSDVTGRKSWWQIQRDFLQSIAVDGEFLAVEVPMRPFGYRLQILDPEMLPIGFDKDLMNGNQIRAGIEYNPQGVRVAYYLHDKLRSPHASMYDASLPENYSRYPADRVIHEFLPEFAIQGRGIPLTTVGLYRLGMLDGYQEAEIIAARVASAAMGFFEQDPDISSGGWTGDEADEDNEGDFTMAAEPGVFRTLPPGLKLNDWNPSRPTSVYDKFIKSCLQQFASGLGVSYAGLANDYAGANYSSLRQALLLERDLWRDLQTWVTECLHDRVYDNWLTAALTFGKIKINGQEPRRNWDEYRPREWQGRRWQWVDPQKELTAIQTALQLGVRSEIEIIREMGRDPDAVLAERAAWKKKLEEYGLPAAETLPMIQTIDEGNDDD